MKSRILKFIGWSFVLALTMGLGIFMGREFAPAQALAQSSQPTVTPELGLMQVNEAEPGILIAGVVPDSPAAEAGLARGDILLEVNGTAVNHVFELRSQLAALKSGDSVSLKVMHGDDERTLTATLTDRNGLAYLGVRPCEPGPMMGAAFGPGKVFNFEAAVPPASAHILGVEPGSPAESAGLQPGDLITAVDGESLDQGRSLAEIVAGHVPGDSLGLDVERKGEDPQTITATLGEKPDQVGVAYLGVRFGPAIFVQHMRPGEAPMTAPKWRELPSGEGVVAIQQVADNSPASAAGLAKGDVITAIDDEAVTEPRAVVEIVQAHQSGDSLTLTVKKAGQEDETTVEVTLAENPDQAGTAYLGVALRHIFRFVGENGEDVTIFEIAPDFHWQRGPRFNELKVEPPITSSMFMPAPNEVELIWSDDGSL